MNGRARSGARPPSRRCCRSRARLAWAPKLAAAAADLPPGTGILNLQATQRDIFVVRSPTAAGGKFVQDAAGLPQIAIAILSPPSEGGQENLALYADSLKKDGTFMNKFDSVHLVAMEQDNWQNKPVEILHVHAEGTPK